MVAAYQPCSGDKVNGFMVLSNGRFKAPCQHLRPRVENSGIYLILFIAKNTIKVSLSTAISAFGETRTISENLERQLRMPPLSLRFHHRLTFALLSLMTEKYIVTRQAHSPSLYLRITT
jgi:hypothetical protein